MHNLEWRQFTPVRAPKVRTRKRQANSIGGLAALEKLHERERELKRLNYSRAVGGCIAILISCAALPMLIELILPLYIASRTGGATPTPDLKSLGLVLDGVLLLFTTPLAIAATAQSRSHMINEFIDTGTRPTGGNDHFLIRIVLLLVTLLVLYGEFLIFDAIRFSLLRIRLRNVDRHRAALILAKLLVEPAGIDPRTLLEFGENPLHLREVLGYLMAYEFAEISSKGDWLGLLSQSKRELRHAKEGLFEFS